MRAWLLNGTTLKGLSKVEITNPTRSFEELVERAVKMEHKQRKNSKSDSSTSSSSDTMSSLEEELKGKGRDWQHNIKLLLKNKIGELSGVRSVMPEKGEKWCTHCRENGHTSSQCVKCDYCKRRGHKWEECPIRLSTPTVRLAAPVNQDPVGPPGDRMQGPPVRNYRRAYAGTYKRPTQRKLIYWRCQG